MKQTTINEPPMTPQATPLHPSHFHPVLLEILEHFQIDLGKLEYCEDTGKRAEELGWEDTRSNVGKVHYGPHGINRILIEDPISLRQADEVLCSSRFTAFQKAHLHPSRDNGRLFTIHLLLHEIGHWEMGPELPSKKEPGGRGKEGYNISTQELAAQLEEEDAVNTWAFSEMERLKFLPADFPLK